MQRVIARSSLCKKPSVRDTRIAATRQARGDRRARCRRGRRIEGTRMTGRGARSSLMRLVQGIARRARPGPADEHEALAALRTREALAGKAQARESRREALRRGAALLGAGLVPLPVVAGATAAPTIVVAGGGLAGLAAAWSLARAGHAVTLVEAAPRVGGRCWTERKAFDEGQIAERGGELIDTAHDEIIDLALALGLSLDDLAVASPRGTEGVRSSTDAATTTPTRWPTSRACGRRCSAIASVLGDELPTFARTTPRKRSSTGSRPAQWLASTHPGRPAEPAGAAARQRLRARSWAPTSTRSARSRSSICCAGRRRTASRLTRCPTSATTFAAATTSSSSGWRRRWGRASRPARGCRPSRGARDGRYVVVVARDARDPRAASRTTSCSRCPSRCCARSTSTARACASASAWRSASSAWGATPSCSCSSTSGRGSPAAATGRRGWKGATR